MPKDPRAAVGFCQNNAAPANPLPAWNTGGAGAGQIAQTIPWPPAAISQAGPVANLPAYAPTGTPVTLPVPTFTIVSGGKTTTANAGSGWNNPSDRTGMAKPVATCTYPDTYVNPGSAVPPVCAVPAADVPPAVITTAPAVATTAPAVATTAPAAAATTAEADI